MSEAADRLGRRAPGNAVLILLARTLSRVVALVVVVRLANHLGAAGYGQFSTLVAYSALVGVAADLGLNTLYTRETARRPEDLGRYLSTLIIGKLPLVAGAILLLAAGLWQAGLLWLLLPGAVMLALSGYSTLFRNSFYALGTLRLEAGAILIEVGVLAVMVFIGVRQGFGVPYFVAAYISSYVASILYTAVALAQLRVARLRPGFEWPLFRSWVRAALPLAAGFLLTNLYFRADIPILQHFRPFAEVGWYQLAYKPFEATQFVPLALQSVVYPVLSVYYAGAPERLDRAYRKFFKVLLLFGWPLTVGVFMLAHPLSRLLRLYPQSEPALRILALGIVFLFVNSAFTAMLYSIDRQHLYAWATAVAAAVNIGLNLMLIPRFGYLAASATTVVTEAVLAATGWWFVGRSRLPWLRTGWRVIAAGLAMALALLPLTTLAPSLAVPIALVVGPGVYALALILLRAVDSEEWTVIRQVVARR
jgi:O-antigen/teichoic acid export membrane protein